MKLQNKVAIVTGGASGIGEATVRLFAAEGAKVAIADIQSDRGMSLAAELEEAGHTAGFWRLDVTSEDDWERLAEESTNRLGPWDVCVNNAGIVALDPIKDTSLETWNRIMGVNATGVFLGTRTAIRAMVESGKGGSIVNVGSVWGVVATGGSAAYHSSKGTVRQISRTAALAHIGDNIRVNTLQPGYTDTALIADFDEEVHQTILATFPMGMATAEQIAEGALFLATSPIANGTELSLDGGFLAQ